MNEHHDLKSINEKPLGRSITFGIIVGGSLFIILMLIVAAVLIFLKIITNDNLQNFNLTSWLIIEIIFGTLFSIISGWICRKISRHYRGPLILALIIFVFGLLETAEIIRFTLNNSLNVPLWLIISAPFIASTGILIGGYRKSENSRFIAIKRFNFSSFWRYALPAIALISAALISMFELENINHDYKKNVVASALAIDMIVVFPSLIYFLLVRVKKIPWIAVIPSVVIGYTIVLITFSENQKHLTDLVRLLVIPAEIILISYLFIKTRKLFSLMSETNEDFVSRLRTTAYKLLGNRFSADIITTEIGIIYCAFKKKLKLKTDTNYFTVHKKSGYGSVLAGLFIVLFVESVAVHFLLAQWSTTAAWILTGLSIYAMVWFIGDFRAFSLRPIFVTNTHLFLRVGLRWEAKIPLDIIVGAEKISDIKNSNDVLKIKVLGEPNLRLKFNYPVQFVGMYGIRKTTSELMLQVDDVSEFCSELKLK
ncbi:MAG: hypothetical protein HXY50_09790 [Ignavibacteriaceae bacterium]|nr:hypothetical protein [Ignavibacteriaceae bacterium]